MRFGSVFLSALVLSGCSVPQKYSGSETTSNAFASTKTHTRKTASAAEVCKQWQDLFLVPGQPKAHHIFNAKSPQVQIINQNMASRSHRVSHALWHAVRGGLSTNENQQVLTAFGNVWSEKHELCPSNPTNPAGEDFLFMHREMINELREDMASTGVACIPPFLTYDDIKNWPVPSGSQRVGPKADSALSAFERWDGFFQDPKWLASHTLGQVGFALEFTIHNNMHMRFATDRPAAPFRAANPDEDGAQIPYNGNFPSDWKFDDPGYNWLADPYGAAVNPVFWKIHGYVDAVIDRWLSANGFENISKDCADLEKCYQWTGTWTGMPMRDHDKSLPGANPPAAAGPHGHEHVGAGQARENPKATKEFNRRRMKFQWLGVLESSTPKDGPVRATPPVDPYQEASAKVCGH